MAFGITSNYGRWQAIAATGATLVIQASCLSPGSDDDRDAGSYVAADSGQAQEPGSGPTPDWPCGESSGRIVREQSDGGISYLPVLGAADCCDHRSTMRLCPYLALHQHDFRYCGEFTPSGARLDNPECRRDGGAPAAHCLRQAWDEGCTPAFAFQGGPTDDLVYFKAFFIFPGLDGTCHTGGLDFQTYWGESAVFDDCDDVLFDGGCGTNAYLRFSNCSSRAEVTCAPTNDDCGP